MVVPGIRCYTHKSVVSSVMSHAAGRCGIRVWQVKQDVIAPPRTSNKTSSRKMGHLLAFLVSMKYNHRRHSFPGIALHFSGWIRELLTHAENRNPFAPSVFLNIWGYYYQENFVVRKKHNTWTRKQNDDDDGAIIRKVTTQTFFRLIWCKLITVVLSLRVNNNNKIRKIK